MKPVSPPLPPARRLLAATGAALALTLGVAPAALAAPGDNGDVKIHESTTPVTDQSDQPKVCVFYLDAFNFDTVQQVNWTISQQPPTGTAQVLAGSITLVNGTGNTGNLTLPEGHYKLEWTFVGENGAAKQKVFDVSCPTSSPSPSPSPTNSPSPTSSPSPSHSPSHSPKPGPHGGVGTGGGGTSGPDAAQVVGGLALVVGAGGIAIRAMRRRPGRNAES
ncbi:hypothetical protein BX285_4053 [Streptomyces sp. 1114.5]|uniref:hypothetical protein n=1 Tax=Streptomyces sp. 1114.5 TaxID=1938830 RepID=UPI000F189B2C|nr:hypothetical protein [Streptomyces sp. 1114.5]RKT19584.1 hypothetical protein BX285_4053 [Streptomyces sp. 1114.5]